MNEIWKNYIRKKYLSRIKKVFIFKHTHTHIHIFGNTKVPIISTEHAISSFLFTHTHPRAHINIYLDINI